MARGVLPLLALAVVLSACGETPVPSSTGEASATPAAPASPTMPPSPSTAPSQLATSSAPPAWLDATVAHPDAVDAFASRLPGSFCDPCRNLAEDNLFGVAALTGGGFIAVGAVTPPASAIALRSTDGMSWMLLPGFSAGQGSAAVAVAESGRTTVIVGQDHTGATSWASGQDGIWQPAPSQPSLRVPYAAGGMTSVIAFDGGFVAAGYRDDPAHLKTSGAAWRSADGRTWSLDDDRGVFAGGRVLALAAQGTTLVAVGSAGDQTRGPAAAWRWTRAAGWQRATVPPGGGPMRAVVVTEAGLVAVGANGDDTGAAVWTSADGATWHAVPDQPAFHYFALPVRLQAVAAVGGGLVAAGWCSDPGNGSSVAVTSPDGRDWSSLPWQPSFSGGEIDGLAVSGATLVAAGRIGYPDNDTAAVWVRAGS